MRLGVRRRGSCRRAKLNCAMDPRRSEEELQAEWRNYILYLLSQRDYPRPKLITKLRQRGASETQASHLLDSLAEQGLFREGAYAALRARSLARRGIARSQI